MIFQGQVRDLEAQRQSLEGELAETKGHWEERVRRQEEFQGIQMRELRQQVSMHMRALYLHHNKIFQQILSYYQINCLIFISSFTSMIKMDNIKRSCQEEVAHMQHKCKSLVLASVDQQDGWLLANIPEMRESCSDFCMCITGYT